MPKLTATTVQGSTEVLIFTVKDRDGAVADPTSITHTVTDPDGNPATGSPFDLADHTRVSEGVYELKVEFDAPGRWKGVFVAETPATSSKRTEAWVMSVEAP